MPDLLDPMSDLGPDDLVASGPDDLADQFNRELLRRRMNGLTQNGPDRIPTDSEALV
jgi:hypothetical protein